MKTNQPTFIIPQISVSLSDRLTDRPPVHTTKTRGHELDEILGEIYVEKWSKDVLSGGSRSETQMYGKFRKCLQPRLHSSIKGVPQVSGDKPAPTKVSESLGRDGPLRPSELSVSSRPTRVLGFPGTHVRRGWPTWTRARDQEWFIYQLLPTRLMIVTKGRWSVPPNVNLDVLCCSH